MTLAAFSIKPAKIHLAIISINLILLVFLGIYLRARLHGYALRNFRSWGVFKYVKTSNLLTKQKI